MSGVEQSSSTASYLHDRRLALQKSRNRHARPRLSHFCRVVRRSWSARVVPCDLFLRASAARSSPGHRVAHLGDQPGVPGSDAARRVRRGRAPVTTPTAGSRACSSWTTGLFAWTCRHRSTCVAAGQRLPTTGDDGQVVDALHRLRPHTLSIELADTGTPENPSYHLVGGAGLTRGTLRSNPRFQPPTTSSRHR
jgi:hypothetical protein